MCETEQVVSLIKIVLIFLHIVDVYFFQFYTILLSYLQYKLFIVFWNLDFHSIIEQAPYGHEVH